MSNKEERETKEMKNLFGDPKTARMAWRAVGAAILQSPCSSKIDICDKDGVSPGQLKDESVREQIYREIMGEEEDIK